MSAIIDKKKTNNLFSFLKGLACIGVVFIHVPFPGITGQVIAKISAFAVPLFIMVAGYYAFDSNTVIIMKRLRKNCLIFLYGLCIFFAYESINHLVSGDFEPWITGIISVKSMIKLILFCTIDFAIPLWYLVAMIETYLLWYFVVKAGKEELAIKPLPLLLIAQVSSITICDSLNIEWFWKINFATRALVWFLLGYYCRKNKERMLAVSNVKLICLVVAGCAIALVSVIIDIPVDFSSLGLVIYSTSIFILGANNPEKRLGRLVEYIGDKLSLDIYILHCAVAFFIKMGMANMLHFEVYSWCAPIVVLVVTGLLAFMINMIIRK